MGLLDTIKNKAKEIYTKVDSTTNPSSARNESWKDVSKRYGVSQAAQSGGWTGPPNTELWKQTATRYKLAGQKPESFGQAAKRYGVEAPPANKESWSSVGQRYKVSGQKPETWEQAATRYKLANQKPESFGEVALRYKMAGQKPESWSEVGQRYGVQSTYGKLKSGAATMGSAIARPVATEAQKLKELGQVGYKYGAQTVKKGAVGLGHGLQRTGRYVENRLPQKIQGVNTRGDFLTNLRADARGGGRAPPTAHLEVAKRKVVGLYNKQSQFFKPVMSDAKKAFGQVTGEGRKVSGTYYEYEKRRKMREALEGAIARNPELKPYLARQGLYGPVRQSQNMFYPKDRKFRKL